MISVVFDGIEIAGRLVAEQDFRVVDERARDRACAVARRPTARRDTCGSCARARPDRARAGPAASRRCVWAPVTCIANATFSHTVLSVEQFVVLEDDAEVAPQRGNARTPQTVDANAVDE